VLTDRDALRGSVPCVAWAIEAQTPSGAARRFAGRGRQPIPRLGSDRRKGYQRPDAMEASMRPAVVAECPGATPDWPVRHRCGHDLQELHPVVLMQPAAKLSRWFCAGVSLRCRWQGQS